MAIVITSIVIAVGVYMIVFPLFSRSSEPVLQEMLGIASTPDSEVVLQRDKVFTMLGELEYDYRMDKIAADDYDQLRTSLTEQAAALVHKEHAQGQAASKVESEEEQAIEQALEVELQRIVAQLTGDQPSESTAEPAAARTGAKKAASATFGFCPECGVPLLRKGQKYCHACGSAVAGETEGDEDA